MAQTGYTPILIYSSSTTSQAPSAGNLTNSTLGSELAINITDGKLFYKDNGGSVQVIAWKTTPTSAGGTGLTSYAAGDTLYYATGTTLSKLSIGAAGYWMGSSGTAPQWNAPAALTKTDDTNVTLTLGGSASTALLNAASLTLGWTGQLAVTRGGTGLSTVTQGDLLYGSASNTLSALAKNTTASRYLSNSGTSNNPAWAQVDLTNGVTGTLPTANGGTNLTSFTANAILYASSTSALATSGKFLWDGSQQKIGDSSSKAEIYLASSGSGSYITGVSSASSSNGYVIGHITAVSRFQVQVGGTGGVELSSGGTSWSAMSDERLKDVIEPITSAIDKVNQLRSVIGKYKTDAADKRRSFLIAQDVKKVLPEAVSETTLAKDATDTYLTVAYTDLIPLLVAAINEMSAEIKALKGN